MVDVENLAGTPTLTPEIVSAVRALYLEVVGVNEGDHVVIASSHHGAYGAWMGWSDNPRRLLGSGPDGADNCLLGVLSGEKVATRFNHVVIGSGDGIFSTAAAQLQEAGVAVTVVSRPGSLSRQLSFAVRDVRFLAPVPATTAVMSLPVAA